MVKKTGKILLIISLLIGVILISLVTTLDWTPYKKMPYYADWKKNLTTANPITSQDSTANFTVGFAKASITPPYPTPMAGYGNRWGKPFESVHDSIYARTIFVTNAHQKVALVALDMLIVPPTIYHLVLQKMKVNGLSETLLYINATHSHNSVGGWYNTLVGRLFAGKYDSKIEELVSDSVIKSIKDAQKSLSTYTLNYEEDIDEKDIINRMFDDGKIDPVIRSLVFTSEGRKKVILTTYAAHATVLDSKVLQLSRDYAGVVVDSLEKSGVTFAQFMSGAVASMGPNQRGATEFDQMENEGTSVFTEILSGNEKEMASTTNQISYLKIPLPLRKPSPRLNQKFALRPFVFRQLFGDSKNFVTALRLGNNLLVGMPCDFSGELMQPLSDYAKSKGLNLIVTSFNGGYIGYVTDDKHFKKDTYETITMNWYGPDNGAYLSEVIKDLVDVFSKK